MTNLYFKMLITDITDQIFEKAAQTNAYTMRKTIDGQYGLLKFELDNVPFDVFRLGYSPMNHAEAVTELTSGDW